MGLIEEVEAARRLPPPAVARAIRRAAGVSQVRLAAELHVHRITIVRWENGTAAPSGQLRLDYVDLLDQLQRITSS